MLIAERLWEILNRQIILLTALDAFIAEVGIFNGIINRGGASGKGHFDSIIGDGRITIRRRWRLWPENPAAERIAHQLMCGNERCAKKKELFRPSAGRGDFDKGRDVPVKPK